MNFTPTKESAKLVDDISEQVKTFHHHYHILYDIGRDMTGEINYVEIGCYAGASACLMLQRPQTNVFSIDTGSPIPPDVAQENVRKFNKHHNNFKYLCGSSHSREIIKGLRESINGSIDILFIDGGHAYNDVITDFEMYSHLVKYGGYIVFDDYLDYQYSPEVRPAIDAIIGNPQTTSRYEIIGTIANDVGAYPKEIEQNNCFILRKKELKIAIVTATYMREDGKTPMYLNHVLDCVQKQTYKNYKMYVIGDKYENEQEFIDIVDKRDFVTYVNLSRSIERETYPERDFRRWCVGGLTALLEGIVMAQEDGFDYICLFDHDDIWEDNHLSLIASVIQKENPLFICTISSYNTVHLPHVPIDNTVEPYLPVPGGMIKSSACINYSNTELRLRDVYKATGKPNPGDADLWARMTKEMQETGKKGFLIRTLTCYHDEEGYVLHG